MIRALCEREYLQPSSVLSLNSDRVQRIEHSSGERVSCERGDVTLELYRIITRLFLRARFSEAIVFLVVPTMQYYTVINDTVHSFTYQYLEHAQQLDDVAQ